MPAHLAWYLALAEAAEPAAGAETGGLAGAAGGASTTTCAPRCAGRWRRVRPPRPCAWSVTSPLWHRHAHLAEGRAGCRGRAGPAGRGGGAAGGPAPGALSRRPAGDRAGRSAAAVRHLEAALALRPPHRPPGRDPCRPQQPGHRRAQSGRPRSGRGAARGEPGPGPCGRRA